MRVLGKYEAWLSEMGESMVCGDSVDCTIRVLKI